MKKFILFLIAIMAVGFVNAQTAYIDKPATYVSYTNDITVTNSTAATMYFTGKQDFPATQDYLCVLDSTSGNHTNVAVALYGQKFASSAWAQIGSTINWVGTTSDTTIVLSNATANRYRKYKVIFTGTGTGVTTVDSQELKLWLE
ncbi:MAG: hypothetical protein GWP06_02245 [Actinobacteria bacterium]|nr:hypothetical protein [Actinomycetota bacterium]